jgi:hypothetical protein
MDQRNLLGLAMITVSGLSLLPANTIAQQKSLKLKPECPPPAHSITSRSASPRYVAALHHLFSPRVRSGSSRATEFSNRCGGTCSDS